MECIILNLQESDIYIKIVELMKSEKLKTITETLNQYFGKEILSFSQSLFIFER